MKHPPYRARGAGGFTLAEAVVALALLSIVSGMVYSFFLFTHRQVITRERKAFAFDGALSLLQSVAKNIRQSRATLALGPSRWLFLNVNNDTASYVYREDTLLFNGGPLSVAGGPIASFSFSCFGIDSAASADSVGEIGFDEIDRNRDGVVSGRETGAITGIRVALVSGEKPAETLAVLETVKNRLCYDSTGYETYFR